jgi:hypothetical protein
VKRKGTLPTANELRSPLAPTALRSADPEFGTMSAERVICVIHSL